MVEKGNERKFEIMLDLELTASALEEYLSLKQEGKSDKLVKEEIKHDLGKLIGEFTYFF